MDERKMGRLQGTGLLRLLVTAILVLEGCVTFAEVVKCREISNINSACVVEKDIDVSSECSFQFALYEDCPIGAPIFDISGDGASIGGCEAFELTDQTLSLVQNQDAETTESLTCVDLIAAGGDFDSMTSLVNINDVNEFPPLLVDADMIEYIEIYENNDAGFVMKEFSVADNDRGEEIHLSKSNLAEFGDMFTLDESADCTETNTGSLVCPYTLILDMKLDYEEGMFYQLDMTFTSGDSRGNESSVIYTVLLFVQDQPDNPPFWTKLEPSAKINEEQSEDTAVYTVLARDRDIVIDNKIKYEIIAGNEEKLFKIDADTGSVTTTGKIDRESLSEPFFDLVVEALEVNDDGTPADGPNTVNQTTNVKIEDINDHSPELSSEDVAVDMEELTRSSMELTNIIVNVTDMDEVYGSYDLTTSDPDHFAVTPASGSLITMLRFTAIYVEDDNIFDYDTASDKTLTFTVTATERDDPTHTDECTVTITLKDANDNTPVFTEEQYEATIEENSEIGDNVATVKATDADASEDFGTNSIIYSLESCDSVTIVFAIDETSGVVTVSGALDYELQATITCTVAARDNNAGADALKSTSTLVVTLLDVNDTPPTISNNVTTEVNVYENTALETVVLSISASDPDTAADVIFDIEYQPNTDDVLKGWFKIIEVDCVNKEDMGNTRGGDSKFCQELRVAANIDREFQGMKGNTLQLTIVASDTNTTQGDMDDTVDIEITILDQNDVTPEFSEDCLQDLTVWENSPKDTPIVIVTAEDPDEDDDGKLTFSCSNNEYVSIDEASGLLSVTGAIDRENIENDIITVSITVTDTVNSSTTEEVDITVLDRNDEEPQFDMDVCQAEYSIREDADHGDPLATVTATDADIGVHAKLTFVLQNLQISTGNNKNTPFAIDPKTGEITVFIDEEAGRVLDRETEDEWTLQIRVYDDCNPLEGQYCSQKNADCYMPVIISDVNDEYPVLMQPLLLTAKEDLKKGSMVQQGSSDSKIMAVDHDEINTKASEIHYEVIDFYAISPYPTWDFDLPFFAIDGNESKPTGVEWFCTLESTMNLTHKGGYYELIVKATDGDDGGDGNSNNLTVQFRITDANDFKPVIVMLGCLADRDHVINITEEMYDGNDQIPCSDGGDFAVMSYTDDDSDQENRDTVIEINYDKSIAYPEMPGQLDLFEIRSTNTPLEFGIFLKDGSVYISLEEANAYKLCITATNIAEPQLSSEDWIYINIKSVSEFEPVFCTDLSSCYSNTFITEETTDTERFLEATDEDNSDGIEHDVIYYDIIGGDSDVFTIPNRRVAALRPKSALDRDFGPGNFTVLVQASNNEKLHGQWKIDEPTDFTMLQVTVILMDVNDNAPVFPEPVIFGSVMKLGSDDQEAAILHAADVDLNETLIYNFVGDFMWYPDASYGDMFEIENVDNEGIVVLKGLPSVLSGFCIVDVSVVDKLESDEYYSSATLQIFVVTGADQVPFYFQNNIVTLQKNAESITTILGNAFNYEATIDSMTTTSGNGDNSTLDSVLSVHFVNASYLQRGSKENDQPPGNLVPKSIITSAASSGVVSSQLQDDLEEIGLTLYRIGDTDVEYEVDLEAQLLTFQILLAVITMLLGSLVFVLMGAYIIRTRKLELRLKVLSTNTFGSQASELNRTGIGAVPNSNLFREGTNPMWNTNARDINGPDNSSISSGDSVLVGVEDNPEFRDYKLSRVRGQSTDVITSGNAISGPGGMTSSNPLFAGIQMNKMENSEVPASSDDGYSDTKSEESGDLGTPKQNFTFL